MSKHLKIYSLILAMLLMISVPVFAEVTDYQIGARPIGMGGAFVGVADDANAAYWNPAGLPTIGGFSLTSMYAQMFSLNDLTLSYVATGYSHNNLGIGVSFIQEKGTLEELPYDADPVTSEYGITRAGLSLAYNFFSHVSLGATGNMVKYDTAIGTKSGYTVDAGVLLTTGEQSFGKLNVAGVMKNAMVSIDGEELSPVYQAGFSYEMPFISFMPVTVAADVKIKDDISDISVQDISYHAGLEMNLLNTLQLRGGYNDGNLTGGVGLTYKFFVMDYAYSMHELGATHRISGGLKF